MKKPSIPTPAPMDNNIAGPLKAIKLNLDVLTGRIGGEIVVLSTSATNSDIISKINEIVRRLNAST